MTPAIDVREATADDHAALVVLFTEMEAYYQVACPPPEVILAGLATRPPGARLLIAHHQLDAGLVGFAAFSGIYPGPGLKPGLFMKELYVESRHRGLGIGTQLMRRLAQIAVEEGYGRIDWTADAGDAGLLTYYETIGATAMPAKRFFRVTAEGLANLAK